MGNTILAESIEVAYNNKVVINGLNVSFNKPEIISIIGPNGSGKSTLLKAIGRLLKPQRGLVLLDGKDIHSLPTKVVAQKMSILPQGPQTPDDISVRDLVLYGRSPYHQFWKTKGDNDDEIIEWAMKETGISDFAHRPVNALSGGERQRAWIAMSLAQRTDILLLDEPTTFLDIHHQFETMELLQRLHGKYGMLIVMVLHDLNHAARFSHRVIVVKKGSIIRDGRPSDVITEDTLSEAFSIKARIMSLDESAHIVCIPYGVCK